MRRVRCCGITAAGGAWNASIVAEIATYGNHHLVASGPGASIAQATTKGGFPEVLADARLRPPRGGAGLPGGRR